MEKIFEYLLPRTFGKVHYVAVVFWIFISIMFLAVFAEMENSESRFDFRCGGAKGEYIDLVRGKCFEKYTEQYNKFAFPIYGYESINVFLVAFVCAIYSQIVRPKVDQVSRSIDQETASSTGHKLYTAYCLQLLIRLVLGVIFIILQTQLLYPLKFSSNFNCYLTDRTTQSRNSSDTAQTSTLYECHNQRAVKKTFWMYAVLAVNGILVAGILIETVYIFSRAGIERSFIQDSKFLKAHLNFSHDKSRQEPPKQERMEHVSLQVRVHDNQVVLNLEPQRQDDAAPPQPREREPRPNPIKPHQQSQHLNERNETIPLIDRHTGQLQERKFQQFVGRTKEIITQETQQLLELESPFSGDQGEDTAVKHLTLDQIYTNLVVIPNRITYDFTENREEQLKVYPMPRDEDSQLKSLEDLLNDKDKRKVLIVGRPGIGKTLCCTKLVRDWAGDKIFKATPGAQIYFDAAFFVKFRKFDANDRLTLRELLIQSEYFPTNHLDDGVWNHLLENPQGILLLFDGFDEFDEFEHNADMPKVPPRPKTVEEKMPLQILYQWLVTGKLLKGASVLTTTRPTALRNLRRRHLHFDKTFEILGFSSEQVMKYVDNFAGEDAEAGETLWRHISCNMNLLSLCYVPVNSFIVCSSLSQILRDKSSAAVTLPSKLTAIYIIAVKVFYSKHAKEFRNEHFTREDIESDYLPTKAKTTFEKLGRVAFEGVKQGKLILGGNELRGIEDSPLFHRLPHRQTGQFKHEEQFCFIHLTMQEFFAAWHMANTMTKRNLKKFVSKNIKDGKWQLVFQFLAGLMNDTDQLPSKIFIDLLPVKTTMEKRGIYYEDWPEEQRRMSIWPTAVEREEERRVTIWPTAGKRELAVTLLKCINETVNENESSNMESVVKRKLQQINCNFVDFNSSRLTAVDCASIVNVIKNVHKISLLDLSRNNIDSLGCLEICKLLKCSNSQLSWLDLTANQLKDEAAKYLADAITNNNCQLRRLNLTYNKITDTGAQHLADAITNTNCQLRTLYLRYNNITDTGAQHLADAITNTNCQLRTLDLYNNNITDTGAQHLADAITNKNCQLRTLNLYRNNITDTGAQHLADAITNNNCQLRTLNLFKNNIRDTGVKHFADAITNNNCQLRTLHLSLNNITEAGKQHALKLASNRQSKCNLFSF